MSDSSEERSPRRSAGARWPAVLAMIAIAFAGGYLAGSLKSDPETTFHDILVSDPDDLPELIAPDDRRVHALADRLQTPENAYLFVRDRIAFDASLPALPAGEIIEAGRASCLGKAILLCSLYRAMGIPASDVRVVTGELAYSGAVVDHAWLDMEYQGACIQQDATDLIGKFAFDEFPGTTYVRSFVRRETYAFNDVEFVVVSRLNQLKGSHPAVP